ncbi:hypothetical protein HAX54_047748 [Datura stramonium]|uniref:Uncharacterized protein n=1 Tax=Datura stramonium TaxID=4076 RepID=A0ABS8STA5_DATST|nr:hypothetical protein [Datura stramonium]
MEQIGWVKPKHHTTRIDANPPRYRTCDSHRIRLAQRLLNPSRALSSTSPLQSSIKLAFPRRLVKNGDLSFAYRMYRLGFVPNQKEAFWRTHACGRPGRLHKLKDYDYKTGRKRQLFSVGLDIDGKSIDRSSS